MPVMARAGPVQAGDNDGAGSQVPDEFQGHRLVDGQSTGLRPFYFERPKC